MAVQPNGIISGSIDQNICYNSMTAGPDFYSPPLLLIERASAVYFGIRAYGVHVNGYVEQADGSILLWVGRRSASKSTWPSKLDHIVAGGQVEARLFLLAIDV